MPQSRCIFPRFYAIYTVSRNITHSKEFAGNHSNPQNLNPSLLSKKPIFMGMKKKNGGLQKFSFLIPPILNFFLNRSLGL